MACKVIIDVLVQNINNKRTHWVNMYMLLTTYYKQMLNSKK